LVETLVVTALLSRPIDASLAFFLNTCRAYSPPTLRITPTALLTNPETGLQVLPKLSTAFRTPVVHGTKKEKTVTKGFVALFQNARM
jgi:hypothetical protein